MEEDLKNVNMELVDKFCADNGQSICDEMMEGAEKVAREANASVNFVMYQWVCSMYTSVLGKILFESYHEDRDKFLDKTLVLCGRQTKDIVKQLAAQYGH